MKQYRVTWVIDVWAETPADAAIEAREIQRDRNSIATMFDVEDVEARLAYTVDVEISEEIPDGTPD